MKKYIGTKIIEGERMHSEDAEAKLGREIVSKYREDGYLVRYPDGYESWSPREQFEEAYRETTGMSFGLAIEAIKKGYKIARSGWNGKGMYLWLLPASEVKKEWVKDPMLLSAFGDKDTLNCLGSIRMLTATGEVLTGWLASQSDMLSDDWEIIE